MSSLLPRVCVSFGVILIALGGTLYLGSHARTEAATKASTDSGDEPRPLTAVDCGAVCLFTAARLYGIDDVTLDYLRGLTTSQNAGTTLYALKIAAHHIGFSKAHGRELSPKALTRWLEEGDFAILHLKHEHFVCAIGLTESGRIVILDGVHGASAVEANRLTAETGWSGKALVLGIEDKQVPTRFRED
jgi:ABC-type bacteriocin/lantibiotic exporter with double-glycine peptidase domain